jgi:predicted negative regulator of RcsB-dependent stress response
MATLDLEEQEQLDQLKHFWRRYGNLISWTLVVALGGYAAWNGWQYWQRDQGAKASGMYGGLVEAAQSNDAARTAKVFDELKDRYGSTAFAEQGGLLTAKVQADQGKASDAEASLRWVAEHAKEDEYSAVARLRLAGLLLDRKQFDDAAKQLAGEFPKHFEPLAADRRGDVLLAQGKTDDAVKAYQQAYAGLTGEQTLRRLVEAKLASLGATPPAVAEAASGVAR